VATVTGSWVGSGGARGRLICEYSTSNISDTVTRVSGSVKAEADNSVYDSDNELTRSGAGTDAGSGSVDLSLSSGGKQTIFTWTKDLTRGASAGSRAAAFSLSGVNYWGATASVSVDIPVPAVPAPDAPTSVSITRVSLSSVRISWGGGTAHHVQVRKRRTDGDGSAGWEDWVTVSSAGASVSSGATFSVAGDRDYQARVRRQNSADVWSDYGTSSNTARLYDAPNAPTSASVARVNDASHKISLSGSSASGKPIRWVDVQFYGGVSQEWRDQATGLAASTRSYTSTTNIANNSGRWRVRFRNSAGSSAWVYTSTAYGTPTATSKPTAKRSGSTDVIVSWTNTARFAAGIDLRAASSTDGGTTWTGYSALTGHTGLGPAVTSRTVAGLGAAKLWKFETRTYVTSPATLSAYSGGGNVLQLLAPPSAPTLLAPTGTISDQEQVTFSWRHNPVDGSDQTAASLRYRIDGGAWVTLTATTAESITTAAPLDAGTLEWQVQTKGSHASYGAWSGVASLLVASPPAVTIITPVDGATVASNRLVLTLGWGDAQGAAMTRRTRRLRDASGEVIEEVSAAGAATTITYTTRLADGETYTAEVEATSGTGLKSGVASATISVDYIDPEAPILSADWIEDQGHTVIAVTNSPGNPAGTPPTVDTATNRVERSDDGGDTWVTVAEGIEPDGGLTDWQVPLNSDVLYRPVAVSALGAEAIGEPIGATTSSMRVWINSDGETATWIAGNLDLSPDYGVEQETVRYYGRAYPVTHYGEGRTLTVDVSGRETATLGIGQDHTVHLGHDVFYRDPAGRAWWATTAGISLPQSRASSREVSLTVTRVEGP
jgi:hypothetical protein